MKKTFPSIVLVLAILALPAFGAQNFTIGTTSMGSTWQIYGTVFGNIIAKTLPDTTASIQITNGPAQNIQLIEAGEMKIGMATDPVAYDGWTGAGWARGKQHQKVRALFAIPASYIQAVALASRTDLNSIRDMEGKRVLLQAPGASVDVVLRASFEALGIKTAENVYIGPVPAIDMLKEGRLDVHAVASPAFPSNYYVELQLTTDIKLLGIEDEDYNKILEKYPYFNKAAIPAGSYKNQEKDIQTFILSNFFVVDKDLPEDMVYRLVKAVFENREEFVKADTFGSAVTPENALRVAIPLHPGAIRYYQEIGLTVPERLIPKQ